MYIMNKNSHDFLVQFGINEHLQIFQRPPQKIEKFTCAYLFQIALEIM